jgi:hypothetical protein
VQKILVKAILYKLINKYEVLNFFNIFSKIGLIPAEGRIFHIQNQKFFIPANRRELAEALFNIDPELKALEMIKTHFQKKRVGTFDIFRFRRKPGNLLCINEK